MDDVAFQRWSGRLTELRKKRQSFFDQQIQQKGKSFGPDDFYNAAMGSLENIMEAWFEFEQKSWQERPPEDVPSATDTALGEMESMLDFEIEALGRDKASATSHITWEPAPEESGEAGFRSFTEELRKRYQVKARGLSGSGKKKVEGKPPLPIQTSFSGRSPGGHAVGLFVMFLVGLLFGGAPSFYFLDSSKKVERKFQEDRSKLLSEQRALADNMAVLRDSFEQLALGKASNIPHLEKEIGRLKSRMLEKKQRVLTDHDRERERLLKKLPAGDKQDQALNDLQAQRDRRLEALKVEESAALDPLVKQRNLLKDLLK